MKKILSVSILAMLAVAPLAANATDPHRYAGVTIDETTTAQDGGNDTQKVASTAYVKGAYNAAIGKLDTESARVDAVIGATYDSTTGAVTNLNTTNKTLVAAINEVASTASSNYQLKANSTVDSNDITTGAKTHLNAGDGVAANLIALDGAVVANEDHIGTMGNLGSAATTNLVGSNDKDDLVSAVNALDAVVGQKSTLSTTATNTIVAAINEVDSHADANAADIGATHDASGNITNLNTTNKTLVGAINELKTNAAPVSDGTYIQSANTVAQNLSALDTQVATNTGNISNNAGHIGDVTNLTGTNANVTNLVTAVNNLDAKVLTVYSGWNNGGAPTPSTDKVSLAKPAA